jgi:hypothetical protein
VTRILKTNVRIGFQVRGGKGGAILTGCRGGRPSWEPGHPVDRAARRSLGRRNIGSKCSGRRKPPSGRVRGGGPRTPSTAADVGASSTRPIHPELESRAPDAQATVDHRGACVSSKPEPAAWFVDESPPPHRRAGTPCRRQRRHAPSPSPTKTPESAAPGVDTSSSGMSADGNAWTHRHPRAMIDAPPIVPHPRQPADKSRSRVRGSRGLGLADPVRARRANRRDSR